MKTRIAHFRNGNGEHTSSYKVGTGSFQKVNRPGSGVKHSHQFLAEVKEIVKLFPCSSSVPSWQLVCLLFS